MGDAPKVETRAEDLVHSCQSWRHTIKFHLNFTFSRTNKTSWVTLISILGYFAIGVAVYSQASLTGEEGDEEVFGIGNALYFCVVVVSTVGYGDFLPHNDGLKIFTAFFILFALVIASFAISNIVDGMQSYAAHKIHLHKKAGIFESAKQTRKRRVGFAMTLSGFVVFLVIGTVGYAQEQEFDEGDNKWANGFYLTVVTLTTVGFGDIYPRSAGNKAFTVFLMIVGIPVFGASLGALTAMIFGKEKDAIELNLICGMDRDKFAGIEHFCRDMKAFGIPIFHENKISRFEFLCFVLVQNGVVDFENIKNTVRNFGELDVDNSGSIVPADVDAWLAKSKLSSPKVSGKGATDESNTPHLVWL